VPSSDNILGRPVTLPLRLTSDRRVASVCVCAVASVTNLCAVCPSGAYGALAGYSWHGSRVVMTEH
jgi:hypothetical protein